jgi:hypothetical protein
MLEWNIFLFREQVFCFIWLKQVFCFIWYTIKDPLDKVVTDGDGSVRHTNWYEAI